MSIVGGDAFVLLRVDPGVEVDVMGYQSEPYLRFAADGTVYENQRSPATYINGSRYGGSSIPESASAAAEPDWAEVAPPGSGEYAWHDHRSHLMLPAAPAGARPGDQVFTDVVPIVVDGTAVNVRIVSTLMPAPSRWPSVLGARVGVIVIVVALLAPTRRAWGPVLVGVGAIAAVIGWIGYASLPASPARVRSGGCCRCSPWRSRSRRGCSGRHLVGTRRPRSPGSSWPHGRSTAAPA